MHVITGAADYVRNVHFILELFTLNVFPGKSPSALLNTNPPPHRFHLRPHFTPADHSATLLVSLLRLRGLKQDV